VPCTLDACTLEQYLNRLVDQVPLAHSNLAGICCGCQASSSCFFVAE
jgi:hypothetical protein